MQDWFRAYKTFPAHKPDMIFYGDSSTYRGIDPDELLPLFPHAVIHNMGYSSGGMNKEALEYVISQINPEAEHPAIIPGITPYSLSSKARRNEQLHQERNYSFAQILERKFVYPLLFVFEPVDMNTLKHDPKGMDYVQEFKKPVGRDHTGYTKTLLWHYRHTESNSVKPLSTAPVLKKPFPLQRNAGRRG